MRILICVLTSLLIMMFFSTSFAAKGEVVTLQTSQGNIVIKFLPEKAPNTVKNFIKLAKEGVYDGTTFHRVIPGFMIQGGDPLSKDDNPANDGTGGPGYSVNAEFNDTKHLRGVVSMARSADPNSAGSQFFICVADTPHLDGKYTAFGEVIEGMDVADKIVNVKRDAKDRPFENQVVKKVVIETRDISEPATSKAPAKAEPGAGKAPTKKETPEPKTK